MIADHANALPSGSMLQAYRIERVLGAGGFGITYLATHAETGQSVALKEYAPRGVAVRNASSLGLRPAGPEDRAEFEGGLERFVAEARTLVSLRHDSVARIHNFFRANGTAYLAMEYVAGRTLERRLAEEGPLDEKQVRALLPPLLSGLAAVHAAGFLHRDLKPANIMLRADNGRPVMIDFGAARAAASGSFRTLTAIYSAGYTPPEQYGIGGKQGPWTDLYALGATLYRCLSGAPPADAPVRLHALHGGHADPLEPASRRWRGRYSAGFLAAIDRALRLKESERPQSVADFESDVAETRWAGASQFETMSPPREAKLPPVAPPRSSGSLKWLVALAVLAGLGYWAYRSDWPPGLWSSAPATGTAFRDCQACPEMVVVPAGSFMMGSPPTEKDRAPNEGPQRRVTFARPFAIGKFEVTFEEWDACVADNGCSFRPDDEGLGRGRYPARGMSWFDAKAYAAWLSRKTGRAYRLPSEAEWEFAARAGSQTRFPWGEEERRDLANCVFCITGDTNWRTEERRPHRVGFYAANAYGLFDMIGNVSEFVEDCENLNYIGAPTDGRAWLSGNCNKRIARGGSYMSMPLFVRSAYRQLNVDPHERPRVTFYRKGFRLARDL